MSYNPDGIDLSDSLGTISKKSWILPTMGQASLTLTQKLQKVQLVMLTSRFARNIIFYLATLTFHSFAYHRVSHLLLVSYENLNIYSCRVSVRAHQSEDPRKREGCWRTQGGGCCQKQACLEGKACSEGEGHSQRQTHCEGPAGKTCYKGQAS